MTGIITIIAPLHGKRGRGQILPTLQISWLWQPTIPFNPAPLPKDPPTRSGRKGSEGADTCLCSVSLQQARNTGWRTWYKGRSLCIRPAQRLRWAIQNQKHVFLWHYSSTEHRVKTNVLKCEPGKGWGVCAVTWGRRLARQWRSFEMHLLAHVGYGNRLALLMSRTHRNGSFKEIWGPTETESN